MRCPDWPANAVKEFLEAAVSRTWELTYWGNRDASNNFADPCGLALARIRAPDRDPVEYMNTSLGIYNAKSLSKNVEKISNIRMPKKSEELEVQSAEDDPKTDKRLAEVQRILAEGRAGLITKEACLRVLQIEEDDSKDRDAVKKKAKELRVIIHPDKVLEEHREDAENATKIVAEAAAYFGC